MHPVTSCIVKLCISRQQVEQVFAVDSVEGAIDNLRGRSEPWAQMALQNIGKPHVEDSHVHLVGQMSSRPLLGAAR